MKIKNKVLEVFGKEKVKVIILLLVITCIIFIYFFHNCYVCYNKNINNDGKLVKTITNSDKTISIEYMSDVFKNITNRYLLQKENNIYIGKNEKEISNGFYDIEIELMEDNCASRIKIIKLYKEFNNDFDVNQSTINGSENILLYDKDYVDEIVNCLSKIYNLNLNEIAFLKEYIINDYDKYIIALKDDSSIREDIFKKSNDGENVKLENVCISTIVENNLLYIDIKKKEESM